MAFLHVSLSSDGSADSHTYSLGNIVVWLSAGLSMLFALVRIGPQIARRENDAVLSWLLVAYLLSWLPFMLIQRVMFLYHYFPALIFSILLLARFAQLGCWHRGMYAIGVLAVRAFAITTPLTYGWPFDIRMVEVSWLPRWR